VPVIERSFAVYTFGNPMPIGSVVVFVKPTASGPNIRKRALSVARQKYQHRGPITVRAIDDNAS
jgi:hypothetical protein